MMTWNSKSATELTTQAQRNPRFGWLLPMVPTDEQQPSTSTDQLPNCDESAASCSDSTLGCAWPPDYWPSSTRMDARTAVIGFRFVTRR
ncbi:hypothetical protein [Arthrobacter methylotrophus]|uniref:hypothetical protein n=1 Tax=Arthrobacter methylotrophus TaxID=121291 RepID=UPI0031E9E8A9